MRSTNKLQRFRSAVGWANRLMQVLALGALVLGAADAWAGFSVSGRQLLDGNGNPFIMRGINHAHTWYTSRTAQAIPDMASVAANTVRVVLSNGVRWTRNSASDVANVIQQLKANQMIAVLEVHDVTGWGEDSSAAALSTAVDYWIDIQSALVGEEDYVIINIGNEPFGNNVPASTWVNEHVTAIQRLRNAGLTHTLLVDAGNWGQDWEYIMLDNAGSVAQADVRGNTMFSVHMYEVYQSQSTIENYVSTFLNNYNVPLIVGEFGADHQGQEVDEGSIMAVAESYNIGYIGWSWSGNSGGTESLDITYDFDVNNLSPWGDRLINGANGLRATSQIASVFGGQPGNQTPVAFDQSVQVEQDGSVSITLQGSDADGQVVDYTITTEPANGTLSGSGANRVYTPDPGFSGSDLFRFTVTDNEGATSSAATVNITVTGEGGGGGSCVYTVANEWNNGFVAAISISNNGSSTIDGWQVSWQYSGGDTVTSVWNAELSGNNPYTATNLSWNATIQPGQTVEFGFQGTKGGDTAEVPTVTGNVCN